MGLGLLGRGVGDTIFLHNSLAELIVTDMKTKEVLAPSLVLLKDFEDIRYTFGEHTMSDFEGRDFILKAAGVPYDSEYITHAKSKNIPVYMSAALLADIAMKELEGVTIIGVTGTRGKSTVTQMVGHILRHVGLPVHIGGNVRGVANLPLLDEIEDGDYLVLELDSWQLQGFGDLSISPHIAVFTSFLDDHMNYYRNDKERYFGDKAKIYRNQSEYDVLITSMQAAEEISRRDSKVHSVVPEDEVFEMKLLGEHNQVAAGLAFEVGRQCGLPDEDIRKAIATFDPVEGRLQDLGVIGDRQIRVVNDNNATTPDATVAALKATTSTYHRKPIVIIGGADKGLPLEMLEKELVDHAKVCIFLNGTGTERLLLSKEFEYDTLSECVEKAFLLADEGDIILYSPAFASFGKEFNNEYEKNDAFIALIGQQKRGYY